MEIKEKDLTMRTIIATFPIRTLKDADYSDINCKEYVSNNIAAPIITRNFKLIRKLAGYSQIQLANALGVKPQAIHQRDKKFYKPSITATIGFIEFLRHTNTEKPIPSICDGVNTNVRNPKVDLLWSAALKCLDKAFRVGNENYNVDKDLEFLVNIMPLDITLIKVILDRINF